MHHRITIHIHVSDPDCDLVCTGYGGNLRGEFIVPEVPMITLGPGLFCVCDEDQVYELHTCDPDTIWAWARDAKGNRKASWPPIKAAANMPPSISISQKEVQAHLGKIVQITISAADPDDDDVAILKVSGPGELEVHENPNKGSANGTWSWIAKGYNPWQLVLFEAKDQCGASSRAYLLVHILQPPRVGNTEVWVERGGSTTFTLAVTDPDSSGHSISFEDLPDGIAVRQTGGYDGYFDSDWDTHYYTFEISAEKGRVCPGDYEVPYVVTDSDENRAEGVLIIHIAGNRPP